MYKLIKYLLLILVFGIRLGFAQFPPSLDCVKHESSNDDSLTWNRTGACATFVLWRATAQVGPYLALDTLISPADGILKSHLVGVDVWYYLTCLGLPLITSDTVDHKKPETPSMQSVNVNASNDSVRIDWGVSPSQETHGYIVYKAVGGSTIEITTVTGRFNTTYTYGGSSPSSKTDTFYVNAVDSCGNRGVISVDPNGPHNTIFMEDVILDSCAQTATLNWNAYQNWIGGVVEYQVILSVNGGTDTIVSPPGLKALTYTHTGLTTGDTLCFKIRAIGPSGFTAVSNTRCLEFDVVKSANFTFLNSLNVSQNNSVTLKWYADSSADIKRFAIQRSINRTDFTEVSSILPPIDLTAELSYTDQNIFPNQSPYYYRVLTYDNCDNVNFSNRVATIHLSGTALNFVNNLVWTEIFLDIPFDSGFYEVFRMVNGVWTIPTPINVVQEFEPLEYSDNILDFIANTGKYQYLVIANYREPISGIFYQSYSNTPTLEQPFQIFVPNAFIPNSPEVPMNRVFKPEITFIDVFTYVLQIYNRGGQLIFESQDRNLGWDGTYKGKDLPQGLYVWKLNIVDKQDRPVNKKGTVLIIR